MKKDISFLKKYKHKIINSKNYKKFIGSFPRKKKVIMCHGVFDVVHPGHIRHFMYAKNKADVLLVSLTSDKHINKGNYRPHVPENLRAFNLAALDIVDFVIIDSENEPIKNIKKLKPDYFAKGFEYQNYKKNLKTSSEYQTINAYGGKVIFTPGDVVYSSSKIINSSLPNISYEKLHNLMDTEKVTFNDLKKTIKNFSKVSVHVVGDTIVDSYTNTVPIGGPVKYPYLSLLNISKTNYIGGAAIVASHLAFTGCKTTFTSVVGDDKNAKFVKDKLKKNKVKFNLIIDKNRPTTNKNTIVAKNQKLLKLDTLDNTPISDEISEQIKNKISNTKTNAVIFSDFRHGIFNPSSIQKLLKAIPKTSFKAGDSQVASRWGNITEFKNFDLITPNEREARFSLADQDSTVGKLSGMLYDKTKYKNLILKLGPRGVFCIDSRSKKRIPFSIGVFAENILDAVGTGDALLAYSSLSLKVSNSLIKASIIGSLAASCACEIEGNKPINIETIINKIKQVEKKINYIHK